MDGRMKQLEQIPKCRVCPLDPALPDQAELLKAACESLDKVYPEGRVDVPNHLCGATFFPLDKHHMSP